MDARVDWEFSFRVGMEARPTSWSKAAASTISRRMALREMRRALKWRFIAMASREWGPRPEQRKMGSKWDLARLGLWTGIPSRISSGRLALQSQRALPWQPVS